MRFRCVRSSFPVAVSGTVVPGSGSYSDLGFLG